MPGMDVSPCPGNFDYIRTMDAVALLNASAASCSIEFSSGLGHAHFFFGCHVFGHPCLPGGFAVSTLFGRHSRFCHGLSRLNTAGRLGIAHRGGGCIAFRCHCALTSASRRFATHGCAIAGGRCCRCAFWHHGAWATAGCRCTAFCRGITGCCCGIRWRIGTAVSTSALGKGRATHQQCRCQCSSHGN